MFSREHASDQGVSRFCVVAEMGSRRVVSSKTVVHEFTKESGRG